MDEQKRDLRVILRHRRAEESERHPDAAAKVKDLFLAHVALAPASIVAGYMQQGHELNLAPLMEVLRERGHMLALPCVEGPKDPLVFRAYLHGLPLHQGYDHILEPIASAPSVNPEVFLVPLIGFDRTGGRLGQGGGYYDRSLRLAREHRKILAVGIAFAVQEVEALPLTDTDERLDLIVTDKEVINLSV